MTEGGNLTTVRQGEELIRQYLYDETSRMAAASDGIHSSWYQYSGAGNRTVILEYTADPLSPGNLFLPKAVPAGVPSKRTEYVTDLTRPYHNLLQKVETAEGKETLQSYIWDTNAVFLREGERVSAYLQDELGSPIRLTELRSGRQTLYGYDEFGGDLFGNQGETQPFGYTGYQSDRTAGTSYAQAREYLPWAGRFTGRDLIKGFAELPFTLNEYGYCWGNPTGYVDRDGQLPTAVVGGIIGGLGGLALSVTSDVINGEDVDWKRGFKNAALGAAAGAAIGSGLAFVSLPTVAMQVSEYKVLVGTGALFGMICNTSNGDLSFDNIWSGLTTGSINAAFVAVGIPKVNALFGAGDVLGGFGFSSLYNFIAGSMSSMLSNTENILEGENISHTFVKAGMSGIIQAIASGFLGNIFAIAASEITGNTMADRFARQITNNVLGNGLYGYGMGTYISSLVGEKAFPKANKSVN